MLKRITIHSGQTEEKSWLVIAAIVGSLLLVPALLGLGYYIGLQQKPLNQVEAFHYSLDEHQALIDDLRRNVSADVAAFTHRIGLLQAHTNRLNALGSKLVAIAGIDEGEFDFSNVPAMGGADEAMDQYAEGDSKLEAVIEKLELSLLEKEQQLYILEDMLFSKNLRDNIEPKSKPVLQGWVSSRYGYRNDPFSGKRQFHSGIDFAGKSGSPILAAAGGVVTFAKDNGRYGLMIEIDHRNGYHTRYAHASDLLIKSGDVVKKGQKIAEMGSTGRSTGTHLHFEVIKEGKKINPSRLLGRGKSGKKS